jgi:hypothetical protein
VRLRPRQRAMVVWSSSSGRAARHGVREMTRPRRAGRIRFWLRTGALLTIIGLVRLARTARKYPRPALSLAGTAVTVVGISLPSGPVLISGFVILLVALFLPGSATAPAVPCTGRLWAHPLTPFAAPGRHVPPPN